MVYEYFSSQCHEKNVREKKRQLKELKKIIKDKTEENGSLGTELEELNVSVNERRHIHEVNGESYIIFSPVNLILLKPKYSRQTRLILLFLMP